MVFDPGIKPGDVISHQELCNIFKVGNMGGMRRSTKTGTLVIISDHTKGLYDDKWYGNELHYTGMGKVGDQVLSGNQNKTLAESDTNGVEVHLFEVLDPAEYTYRGVVHLSGSPYQETQKDDNGSDRKVWMFPLRVEGTESAVDEDSITAFERAQEQKARSLSGHDLSEIAKAHSSDTASYREVTSTTYVRDPYIAEYAKRRANGTCELCGKPAPFKDKYGRPYLESHHIVWLSQGGADSINNTVALCPNCHRKMHVVADPDDVVFLQRKIAGNGGVSHSGGTSASRGNMETAAKPTPIGSVKIGMLLRHKGFGLGKVVSVKSDRFEVKFDKAGTRMFMNDALKKGYFQKA